MLRLKACFQVFRPHDLSRPIFLTLYLLLNWSYRNWEMMEVLPTLALPITSTLYLVFVINKSDLTKRRPVKKEVTNHRPVFLVTWPVLTNQSWVLPSPWITASTVYTADCARSSSKEEVKWKQKLYPINVTLLTGVRRQPSVRDHPRTDPWSKRRLVIQSALSWLVLVTHLSVFVEKFWSDEGSEIWSDQAGKGTEPWVIGTLKTLENIRLRTALGERINWWWNNDGNNIPAPSGDQKFF